MKTFASLGVAASLASLSLASLTSHSPLNALRTKRALMTCVETYGGGSITCGAPGSPYCYDPTLGEVCLSTLQLESIPNINRLAAKWIMGIAKQVTSVLLSLASAARS